MQPVFHLEKFEPFMHRVVALNRLYAPDDPVLDAIDGGQDSSGAAQEHPEAVHVKRMLHAIHRGFPEGSPVHEQAAYLMYAFAAVAPFPTANGRTGWDYIGGLLHHAGHTLTAGPDDGRELATNLWMEMESTDRGVQLLATPMAHSSLADWFQSRIA